MGYHITIDSSAGSATVPAGMRRATKLGAYGSQEIMMALLFAGYAIGRNPESKRVCAWVEPIAGSREVLEEVGERFERSSWSYHNLRNRPDMVRELVSANHEDSTWITMARSSVGYTYELGAKFKPFADPALSKLVEMADLVLDDNPGQTIDAALAAALAPVLAQVVAELTLSCWHANLAQVVEVFETAAAVGMGVSLG